MDLLLLLLAPHIIFRSVVLRQELLDVTHSRLSLAAQWLRDPDMEDPTEACSQGDGICSEWFRLGRVQVVQHQASVPNFVFQRSNLSHVDRLRRVCRSVECQNGTIAVFAGKVN